MNGSLYIAQQYTIDQGGFKMFSTQTSSLLQDLNGIRVIAPMQVSQMHAVELRVMGS